jgi:hypothetical protein
MLKKTILSGMILFFMAACVAGADIKFVQDNNKIDVLIGGKQFTTYRYGSELTKPILYPVKSPSGIVLTRGFPFEKIPGESNDHPHHTGIFFTYDKVNNDGFWNNTTSPPQIKHIKTTKMENGQLSTISRWVGKSGKVLLEEKRDMVFSSEHNEYIVDFNIVLTAPASPDSSYLGSTPSRDGRLASRGGQDEKVVFGDTKEGMFAIRVADWLSEDKGTGKYLDSEGNKGEPNIWGKRANWVRLEGNKDGKTIGIAIFNHPTSTCYPTYWHARGYGLFSANPLGQLDFLKGRNIENPQPLNFTLNPGQSALFRFRMIIYEGPKTTENLEREFQNFVKY